MLRKGVKIGAGLTMSSFPVCDIHSGATVEIGRNCVIRNKHRENLAGLILPTTIVARSMNSRILIGNEVKISGAIIYCADSIVIEDFVNIGVNSRIYDTDFHPLDHLKRRAHDVAAIKTAPVIIKEDVWIGANVTVLKGVTIGARSVIGAGSMVVGDIPEDCVACGVPARVVRRL